MQSNTQNILAIGIFCQQSYQLPHVVEQVPVENFTVLLADAPNSIYVQKIKLMLPKNGVDRKGGFSILGFDRKGKFSISVTHLYTALYICS